ncbi:sensor histidine kinase [Tenacibaculum agarivorans]|uniref:sensor histidine kinase n=1 Tax=Tenacibaculum agarivorans TaxID=1908389 RepID=UPI0009FA5EAE|nr:two-component regulator propeller domain-containing protein [Tenacibaculum agarivorans]
MRNNILYFILKFNSFILVFYLFFYSLIGIAQIPIYKNITTDDGLGDNITYQIIQDTQGFIWIGTDDGFSRYDGKTVKNYVNNNLRSNYVIDVVEDKKNDRLLLATWGGGLHSFKNDSIIPFNNKKDSFKKINVLHHINDSITVSTQIGGAVFSLYNWNTNTMVNKMFTQDSLQKDLLFKVAPIYGFPSNSFNTENVIYAYATGINEKKRYKDFFGVYKIDQNFSSKKLNIKELNDILVQGIFKDDQYLVASSFNTFFIYKHGKLIFQKELNLGQGTSHQITLENNKLYFIHSLKKGNNTLYSYDLNTHELVNLSSLLSIKSAISDILFDREKNLWVTTYGQGVFLVPNINNTFYGKETFENPDLRTVGLIDDDIITMSHSFLYMLSQGKIKTKKIPFYTEKFQLKNDTINLTTPFIDKKIFSSTIGNYFIENKSYQELVVKFDSLRIKIHHHVYEISTGKTNYIDTIQNNFEHFAKDAFFYKKKLLINYGRPGIYALDLNTWDSKKWERIKDYKIKACNDFVVQKDTVWVATNLGVHKVTPQKTTLFTTQHGLSSNHVTNLHIDTKGVLWAGTQKGLNVLTKNNFYIIDKNLGQKSSSIKKIVSDKKFLYAVGDKGLFKMDNSQSFQAKNSTTLLVKQDQNTFTLNTINYINPESVIISYKLNNQKWVETANNYLDFNEIKQGNYNIKFRFKDNLSNWQYSKTYTFRITLPWFEQTWLYFFLIVLASGTLILLLSRGLKKSIQNNNELKKTLKEKEELQLALKEVRKNVARDFHDELGNKLASISITSGLLISEKSMSNQERKINQIKENADYLYHGMRDFIWSLDHKNDDLQQLQIYLNDFGEKLFENSEITFYSTNNFSDEKVILPFYWSKQLVLIFKEAMTNTLKHSQASEVFLTFNIKKGILKISLKDNGIGLHQEKKGRENGIRNMKERAKTLHQEISITSNNGVKVTFVGNLNESKK